MSPAGCGAATSSYPLHRNPCRRTKSRSLALSTIPRTSRAGRAQPTAPMTVTIRKKAFSGLTDKGRNARRARAGRAKAVLETTPRRASEHRPSNRRSTCCAPTHQTDGHVHPAPRMPASSEIWPHTGAGRIDPGRTIRSEQTNCACLQNRQVYA